MMKLKLTLILLAITQIGFSQKLLWTSQNGGENTNGAIIEHDLNTQQTSVLASLGGNFLKGISFYSYDSWYYNAETVNTGGVITGTDGNIYGISNTIGSQAFTGQGGLYRIDPTTNKTELLHFFSGARLDYGQSNIAYAAMNKEISNPVLGIIEVNNSIYGICDKGGTYDKGGIYRYSLTTKVYEKIIDFDTNGIVGYHPNSPLIIGPNGNLYGVLKYSGNNSEGHLYKIDVTTNTVTLVSSLGAAGWAIADPVMQIAYNPSLNKIFGTKETFAGLGAGGGIWSYNFNNNTVTNEAIILTGQTSTLGSIGNGITPIASDGFHYFTCRYGGNSNNGTLVKYNPNGNTFSKVHDFTSSPSGTGFIIQGDKIYGTYSSIGSGAPLVWSYNTFTQIFTDEISALDNNTVGSCIMHEIAIVNNELYGHTIRGLGSQSGSLFKKNLISSQISIVQENQSVEGRGLKGEITVINDSIAYTYIGAGGPEYNSSHENEQGGIAKINLENGLVYYDTILSAPYSDATIGRISNYSGLTSSNSGSYYFSKISQLPTGKSVVFHQFYTDWSYINAWMGTVSNEVFNFKGVEYQTGKIAFAIGDFLHIYDESNSSVSGHYLGLNTINSNELAMNELLKASNGKLYFTTFNLSTTSRNCGVYAIDPSDFSVNQVHQFNSVAQELNNGLIEFNGKLYGSTMRGGSNDEGYLYSIDLTNNNFNIEHSFDASTEGGVFLGKWTVYNNELYAVSYVGGQNGYGTLVKFNPSNSLLSVLEHLTIENGLAFRSTPTFWDDSSLSVEGLENLNMVGVYPNPAETFLSVDIQKVENIKVFNSAGYLVKEIKQSIVDVSDLSNGLYFLRIKSNGRYFHSKFIKK